jgi:general secretion pathway protein J
MNKRPASGYTLIEVIIALAVFAILSTMSASVMLQAFKTKARLAEETERINKLELAVALVRRDVEQILNRSIRGNEMHLFPPFIGESNYTEFTRGGYVNPNATVQSSTLKRVALICKDQSLTRRSWATLDSPARSDRQDKVLLNDLDGCTLSYVSQSQEILSAWRPYAVSQGQKNASIPAGIQLTLQLKHLGKVDILFSIPEGIYGG